MLRKKGKSNIAVVEPYYTYHAKDVQQVFDKLPIGIPSNDDFSPKWDGKSPKDSALLLLLLSVLWIVKKFLPFVSELLLNECLSFPHIYRD